MKTIKITARYKKWPEGIDLEDDMSDKGVYKVRDLHESNTGGKSITLWGWRSSIRLEEVELMINGVIVDWI